MDKKFKLSYDPPRVTVVAFKVEDVMVSLQTSGPLTEFINGGSWDGPSSSSSTSHFATNDWSNGSSGSGTTRFNSGSWD